MCLSGSSMDGIEAAPTDSFPGDGVVVANSAPEEAAVYVRNAVKSYGVGKHRSAILRNLSMNVKKGTIYGLLGASGCGKTTLLSCIVGRKSLDRGKVMVFGGEPGSSESGIPGPRLGYMPQELALYGEFSIKETLEYFGRIYDLSSSFVKSQMEFLTKLLELPPVNRPVKSLSGGQQRRVSFAVALFHAPELLILDEPTVGVDPMLRKSIWNHLVRLSADHSHTIIITTHYIEEASQAHTIGLMRSGRLLAEDSPANLMALHQLESVEDVFLKLCKKDHLEKHRKNGNRLAGHDNLAYNQTEEDRKLGKLSAAPSSILYKSAKSVIPLGSDNGIVGLAYNCSKDGDAFDTLSKRIHGNESARNPFRRAASEESQISDPGEQGTLSHRSVTGSSSCGSTTASSGQPVLKRRSRTFALTMPSAHRTAALIRKNFTTTSRNIGSFLFIFILPALQSTIFNLAIGRDPNSLKMAVVNEEFNPGLGKFCNYTDACAYSMFSCRYLRALDNDTIIQVPYSNFDEARDAATAGKVWGVIHFSHNFTEDLLLRQEDGNAAKRDTILGSQIGITLDWSNEHIALTIQRRLLEAFDNFNRDISDACGRQELVAGIPLTFTDPVFGTKNPSFTEFMAPGIILTMAYTQALSLTAAVFIHERTNGLLDRSLVAGVQTSEILLAHTTTQFSFLTVQVGLVLLVMMLGFNITCQGSLPLALGVSFLQGLCGMFVGFVISSLCDTHSSALYLSLGSLYPNMLLSGLLWPLEGMSAYLRYVAYFLPMTHAIESLRNIFERGWGIDRPEVYAGVIVNIGWIAGMLLVSVAALRIRKYTS